ncbi:MAG: dockerin type I repeat-containing protein [Clostridia bacterium]|nr:dockerin type I repeat-containing protein [Clostridia bacterium]
MKKILASILALCLIFSAFGTALFTVSAEETVTEPETGTETEVVEQTPIFTATVADWTYQYQGIKTRPITDNTLFDEAWHLNPDREIISTGYSSIFTDADKNEVLSIVDAANWLKTESGQMRFWVKIPWREGTPELSYYFGIGYNVSYDVVTENEDGTTNTETKTAWPETHATVKVAADGLWHEIRISVSDLTSTTVFDSYAANETTIVNAFYALRVRAANTDSGITAGEGWQVAPVLEFYNEAIAAEVNDGNIEESVYVMNTPDTGNPSGLTHENVSVAGENKYSYTARKISRTGDTWKTNNLYAYTIKNPTSDHPFIGWFANKGDMRTYVKNNSDYEITLEIGAKASVTRADVEGELYPGTSYPTLGKKVTIPANSWQEVRISYSDCKPDEKKTQLFTTSTTYNQFYLYIVPSSTMFQNIGDSIYVTPLEICNRNIVADVAEDFEREYSSAATFTSYQSWRGDNNDYVTRTHAECTDLPFFNTAVTYTAVKTFTETPAKQMPFAYKDNVNCEEFANWLCNPDAEMRFWIKTNNDLTFTFETQVKGNVEKVNQYVYSNAITVKGSSEWQEVILKRSDLGTNYNMDLVCASGNNETANINIFLRAITSGMSEGDTFMFSRYVEFFSHEAYDKGDLNRDGAVNVLDLVRTKKFIANAETSFINGDINSDGKLTADDMTYLRKWMITGAWN